MKTNSLFAWLLFTYCMAGHAQSSQLEYRPFAQDGKTWDIQVGLIEENRYYIQIDGDTLIDGEVWKKVYNYMDIPGLRNPSYYAAVRDVGKKVYAIARGSDRPRLLYDFDLKEGDTVMCGVEGNAFGCLLDKDEKLDTLLGFAFISFLRVERIDTIEARGLKHRRFTLTLLDTFQRPFGTGIGVERKIENKVVWVEGIGSGAGPFCPWLLFPSQHGIYLECYVNKEYLFDYLDFESSGSAAIGSTRYKKHKSGIIHDVLGRRLMSQPTNGIYIQNGQKRIR